MDNLITFLNTTGKTFVDFSVPMLIQSSVLIVVLLVVDLLIRKKVRAVFRYCIWMLVLIKLVLPTTLSSPTGVGYWFGDKLTFVKTEMTEPVEQAVVSHEKIELEVPAESALSVRLDAAGNEIKSAEWPRRFIEVEVDPFLKNNSAAASRAGVSLSWEGFVFLGWLAAAGAMVLLLVQRMFFVRGLLAQSKEASDSMADMFERCKKQMSAGRRVSLKLSPVAGSPSVCGLFRPTILIPQNLPGKLKGEDLRSILLHELAHIKRGDLWVSLVQTMLQIAYFYNPLLWAANAIIRKVREQAVDEMVLVAMGARAEDYPETLLNISRLTFSRPVLSLRLIGVVESKKALSGRIKHILSRPFPKSAKLGFAGLIIVLLAATVLLPMAKGKANRKETALTKKIVLPYNVWIHDISLDDKIKILDFASGEIIVISNIENGNEFVHKVDSMPNGDVYVSYEEKLKKPNITFLRGMVLGKRGDKGGHKTLTTTPMEMPYERSVLTREGGKYMVSFISADENECTIEYKPLNKTAKKAMAKVASKPPEFIIKGTVTDAETGQPIAGAKVGDVERYAEGKQWTTTDVNGNYSYKTWYEEHGVKAKADSYKRQDKGFGTKLFGSEKEKVIDFELTLEKAAEQSEFKATLSNGVTVELVGVCEHPSKGKQWWRADGSLMELVPYDKIENPYLKHIFARPDSQRLRREFALQLSGMNETGHNIRFRIMQNRGAILEEKPIKNGAIAEGLRAIAASIPIEDNTVKAEIGVANGPFKTLASGSPDFDNSFSLLDGQQGSFTNLREKNGKTTLTVADNLIDFDYRVIAVDK